MYINYDNSVTLQLNVKLNR